MLVSRLAFNFNVTPEERSAWACEIHDTPHVSNRVGSLEEPISYELSNPNGCMFAKSCLRCRSSWSDHGGGEGGSAVNETNLGAEVCAGGL